MNDNRARRLVRMIFGSGLLLIKTNNEYFFLRRLVGTVAAARPRLFHPPL